MSTSSRLPVYALLAWLCLLAVPGARAELVLSSTDARLMSRISTLVLYEAFSATGLSFSVREYPARRALVEANLGRADGALHRIEGIERNFPSLVRVPVAINTLDIVAVSRMPGLPIERWADLGQYRIGVVRGVVLLEMRTAGMDVVHANSIDMLVGLLEHERVDVILLDRQIARQALRVRPRLPATIAGRALEVVPLYLYLHEAHRALVPALTQALQQMQDGGRIELIRSRVIRQFDAGEPLPPSPVPLLHDGIAETVD